MKAKIQNITAAYNQYATSFNAAMRWIADMAKEAKKQVPAKPAKGVAEAEAKLINKAIRDANTHNNIVDDCSAVVEVFCITANDLKSKGISALRNKVAARFPNVDKSGNAVRFAAMPSYLKGEIDANALRIVPASWIEAIFAAAENATEIKRTYNLTIAPEVEDGKVTENAKGDIVNAKGEVIDGAKILATWDALAAIENAGNAAGRVSKTATVSELKAARK